MKKTFPLTHPKIKPERLVEGIRADVNKYVKRERKKTLPEGVDFWDFACKVGVVEEFALPMHLAEVSAAIGQVLTEGNDTVYVEVLSKPGKRTKKPSAH
jgi:hypothetical protein